jgi:mono/diheme cytochrome c family protein
MVIPRLLRRHLAPVNVVVAMGVLMALSGCQVKDSPGNAVRGKQLFVGKCAACHTLRRAGTQGTVGPNLDAAFARDRVDGFHSDTIRGLVREWIAHPNRLGQMPAKLYGGEDAKDVATYVAMVAAEPGRDTGDLATATATGGPPGRQIFTSAGCSGCHTLADAGTHGTTGPDLDRALKGASAGFVRQSIVDPDAKIAKGYPANVMPKTFGQQLTAKQLKQLVDYLLKVTK